MILIGIPIAVTILIFFNALYVAAEFGTVASQRARVSQLAGEGQRAAQILLPYLEDRVQLDRYVAGCQIGITLSSLVLGAYGENVMARQLNISVPFISATLAILIILALNTLLQVVFGELLPKSIAVQYPERVAMAVLYPMLISLALFRPLIWFFNGSGTLILRLMGRNMPDVAASVHSPEEIELLVHESHEVGLLEDSERQMLRNAFRLRGLTARQVMLHRTRLVAARADNSVQEIMQLSIAEGYSRIPVFRETIDDIVAFVHVKDLFRLYVQGEHQIDSVLRDVVYVPETLPVSEVWDMLNTKRKYMAIVFDEYGGTAGLLTFEDLIEEIFGELQDEFDDEMALVARDKEGRIYLRGDLLVSDVNEYLNLELPTEADTLSGLVISVLGRAPVEGDQIKVGEILIQVESLERLGVSEVSLMIPGDITSSYSEWEVADHE